MPDWLCPACRNICNCSGVTCQRLSAFWLPTKQLEKEAVKLGFESVSAVGIGTEYRCWNPALTPESHLVRFHGCRHRWHRSVGLQAAHYLIRMHLEENACGLVALPPRVGGDYPYSVAAGEDTTNAPMPAAKRLRQSYIVTERARSATRT